MPYGERLTARACISLAALIAQPPPHRAPSASGFFSSPDDPYTFNVWLDINSDEGRANATLTYLRDGFFIDAQTRLVTFEIVTYNAKLQLFSSTSVAMSFSSSGEIEVL